MTKYKKESGIYKITNLVNGKSYIGSTRDIRYRRNSHFNSLRRNSHFNTHLQKAFNFYGEDSFIFEILEYCAINILAEREKHYIDEFRAYDSSFGYNIATHTDSPRRDAVLSESQKILLRNYRLGSTLSEDTKAKIGEGLGGTYFTSLLSPDGLIYILITNLSAFSRNNNLNCSHIRRVITGELKSHKGWRLCQLGLA